MGFTEQVFSEVYLACREELRPETIRYKRYGFICLPEAPFFGLEEIAVLGHSVYMATTAGLEAAAGYGPGRGPLCPGLNQPYWSSKVPQIRPRPP
jgi:hypothetical protein